MGDVVQNVRNCAQTRASHESKSCSCGRRDRPELTGGGTSLPAANPGVHKADRHMRGVRHGGLYRRPTSMPLQCYHSPPRPPDRCTSSIQAAWVSAHRTDDLPNPAACRGWQKWIAVTS